MSDSTVSKYDSQTAVYQGLVVITQTSEEHQCVVIAADHNFIRITQTSTALQVVQPVADHKTSLISCDHSHLNQVCDI